MSTSDIVKLYMLFIIAVMFYLITCIPVPAMSLTDEIRLQKELTDICNQYNRPCKIIYSNSNKIQAYTTCQGNIIITKALSDKLGYDRTKAVGLHEVGHHILDHCNEQYRVVTDLDKTKEDIKNFRYSMETQADLFATNYYIKNKEPNYIPQALTAIIPEQSFNKSTANHPSAQIRINNIQTYTNYQQSLPQTVYTRSYYIPSTKVNYDWRLPK